MCTVLLMTWVNASYIICGIYIVVLCTAYEQCPLKWSIETTHLKKSCASFFIRVTTFNDGKIDKDLLLTKFVPSNIPAYLTTVMTTVCSR